MKSVAATYLRLSAHLAVLVAYAVAEEGVGTYLAAITICGLVRSSCLQTAHGAQLRLYISRMRPRDGRSGPVSSLGRGLNKSAHSAVRMCTQKQVVQGSNVVKVLRNGSTIAWRLET